MRPTADSAFIGALLRSASADGPSPGAKARALATVAGARARHARQRLQAAGAVVVALVLSTGANAIGRGLAPAESMTVLPVTIGGADPECAVWIEATPVACNQSGAGIGGSSGSFMALSDSPVGRVSASGGG